MPHWCKPCNPLRLHSTVTAAEFMARKAIGYPFFQQRSSATCKTTLLAFLICTTSVQIYKRLGAAIGHPFISSFA